MYFLIYFDLILANSRNSRNSRKKTGQKKADFFASKFTSNSHQIHIGVVGYKSANSFFGANSRNSRLYDQGLSKTF